MRLWRHPSAARWEWRRLKSFGGKLWWRNVRGGIRHVSRHILHKSMESRYRHTNIRSLCSIIIWLEAFKRLEWDVKWHANGTLCIDVRCLPKFYTLPPAGTDDRDCS
jgi:hypothetical protein